MDLSLLDRIAGRRVLVVGDVMLDEYLWGEIERISPEAPVPVLDERSRHHAVGGAGNVAANLAALGCRAGIGSVVGEDGPARTLRAELEALGVDGRALVVDRERPTPLKTRVIARRQQLVRIDREERRPLAPWAEERLLEAVRGCLGGCGAVVLSDYGKGVVTEGLVRGITQAARAAGVPVVGDPKGRDYRRYRGVTLLTPNRKEAAEATGIALTDAAAVERAGARLLEIVGSEAMLITLSEEGMALFRRGEPPLRLPTRAREVYDVTGAGDTVVAALAAALAAGADLVAAAELANMAAGVVVGKVGTATATAEEVRAFAGAATDPAGRKVVPREEAVRLAARLRAEGKRLVFTNGCFDLLHVGHIRYLQQARALGDCLMVGLNTDASVRRLKGERRPLIRQEDRAHVLAALACVDYVVLFDEDTPLELIRELRPEVLVKGGDYTREQVVGHELVEAAGGRVELIPVVEGASTTAIVERIAALYGRPG
ncbi:MAG: bifunctional D-glycero-beta-D-manno-heptose-7-phosphate kinase/D-glycero-beta-D-manno-heptose 1-phosphate adenylyltransferase HldE [Nitrospirae bacterium]|nr:MAG: bifunctional D-glycero-beta-D-manno-heptose-7-phosphate kinase/D-glycero-beta-D-manno-heptose 1-phosphate adenylyltransferase HldE [Nitrospirota bacterium]